MPKFIKLTLVGDSDGELYKEPYQALFNVADIRQVYGSNPHAVVDFNGCGRMVEENIDQILELLNA